MSSEVTTIGHRRIYLTIVILLSIAVSSGDGNRAVADLVEELLSSSRYNSRTRPTSENGGPLNVYININVNDISSISEVKMDYSMTLYLREIWVDERLAYGYTSYNRNITLNHNQFERLWTPDLFIRNLKQGVFHEITVPNRMIRLSPDGTVLYSQRLTLTLACDMQLDKYPMDNQTCNIEFGSYAYTTEDLVFHWRTDATPVEMKNISLPEYVITNVSTVVCSKKFSSTGSFPCLRAHFHLDRRLRAYILTTYLPSFLVVLLSWLSFWIDLESAPARTSLSILTILTITTQSSGLLRSMPAGSFTKAIDVWMATCLVFVFGAFIEYSIVNTLARRQKARSTKRATTAAILLPAVAMAPLSAGNCSQLDAMAMTNGWSDESGGPSRNTGCSNCQKSSPASNFQIRPNVPPPATRSFWSEFTSDKAIMVECISRALFPSMFIIFNLVYWPWYLA